MKPRQGLATTAQNYLSTSISTKSQYKCQNCHLIFQTPIQLFNHKKKFCTDSGFDTLAGLNIKLKNPNYGMGKKQQKRKLNDSLTNALEQIQKNKAFKPMEKQLKNDLLNLQRHQQDVKYARPYMYMSKNNQNNYDSNARRSRSLYLNGNEENNQKNNYGQKAYNNYENLNDPSRSKAYSFTSSYLRKFKQSNVYVSPPTQIPLQQNAKQFSLLDKSDMSIKMMPQQQKKQYVIRKILQLQQIEQGYKKNGGKNDQFIENTLRMKKFYQQLLEKINNQKDSMFGGGKVSNVTRVSTPISKLEKLQQSRNLFESMVRPEDGKSSMIKSKISQIQQKNIAKRQDQVRKRFHTQGQGKSQKNIKMNDILDQQMLRKIASNTGNDRQNQIIVIPIQQPANIPQANYNNAQQQSYQTQLTIKYIQSLSALKDQQNKNFLQILQKQNQQMKRMYQAQVKSKQKESGQNEKKIKGLQNKYQKLIEKMDRQREKQQRNKRQNYVNELPINSENNNFRKSRMKSHNNRRNNTQYSISNFDNDQKQYRQLHKQMDNVRLLNLQTPGYHSGEFQQLSLQQKLLLQMQKQQRDELQLFAHLPVEMQQIKLKSIQQLGEKRFQMEKQVIRQKLQKLKMSEQMKAFELERRLLSEQMENEKKKMAIHKLMKKKIKQMVREQFEEQLRENDQYQDEDNEVESRETLRNKRVNNRY